MVLENVSLSISQDSSNSESAIDITYARWRGGGLGPNGPAWHWTVSITNSVLIGLGRITLNYPDAALIDGNFLIDCGRIDTYLTGPITISDNVFVASDPATAEVAIMSVSSILDLPQTARTPAGGW